MSRVNIKIIIKDYITNLLIEEKQKCYHILCYTNEGKKQKESKINGKN